MAKMVKIIKKKDEYSMEYEVGDVLKVDSAWYGGVTVLGKTGVPVSIDKDEYEEVQDISEPEKAEPTSIEEGLRPAGQGVSTEAFDHLKEIEDEVRGAGKDLLAVAGLDEYFHNILYFRECHVEIVLANYFLDCLIGCLAFGATRSQNFDFHISIFL